MDFLTQFLLCWMVLNYWFIIAVVQSKIVAYVGIQGIMVRETKETFGIVTRDDKFRGTAYIA